MAGDNLWVQVSDIGPSPRGFLKLAYDSDRKVTVLFGGLGANNQLFDDTWEWDGNFWTKVAITGPPARFAHVMCYDPGRKKTVLFGGATTIEANSASNDTWEWDGSVWSQVADDKIPARAYAAMDFDPKTKKSILFSGTKLADTWAWDGIEWKQLSDIGPSARQYHSLCNYPTIGLLLYGGMASSGGAFLSDTWQWDGAFWKQCSNFGPKPIMSHALAPDGQNPLIFGGQLFDGTNNGETWEWSGKYWTEFRDIGPSPRSQHALCTDTVRNRIVLFGGVTTGPNNIGTVPLSDTWEFPTK